MNNLLILLVILAALAIGIKFFNLSTSSDRQKKQKPKFIYKKQKFFMSKAEHRCYDAINTAVGNEYYVFAQVHLPTIIDEKVKGQNWKAAWNHINRKSVDFVLCDKKYISPKLAIELDDSTHKRPDRIERDAEVERILSEAGMPLLRLENNENFDSTNLATKIREKLAYTI